MKNKFEIVKKVVRNSLLVGLVGITFGCASMSVKPTGAVDIAYVPIRIDDHVVRNQLMGEGTIGVEATIQKGPLEDTVLTFSARERVFVTPENVFGINWISPTRQEYGLRATISYENFMFYIDHMCAHPVSEEQFWLPNNTYPDYLSQNT